MRKFPPRQDRHSAGAQGRRCFFYSSLHAACPLSVHGMSGLFILLGVPAALQLCWTDACKLQSCFVRGWTQTGGIYSTIVHKLAVQGALRWTCRW